MHRPREHSLRRRPAATMGAACVVGFVVLAACGARAERPDAQSPAERTDALRAHGTIVVPATDGFYDDDGETWIPAVAHPCAWSVYGATEPIEVDGAEVVAARDDGWAFVRCADGVDSFTPVAEPSTVWVQGVVVNGTARHLTDSVVVSVGRDLDADLAAEPYAPALTAAGVFAHEAGPLPGTFVLRAGDVMAASVALVESGLFRWAQPNFVRGREVR